MIGVVDESVLGNITAIETLDAGGMLRAVAGSAAQVRAAVTAAHDAGVARLAGEGRPRAVIATGMGGSGIAGDVLAAVAGPSCPVPISVHRGYGLPGWVGASDLVLALSCSGTTEETLSATEEAVRRGASVLAVAAPDSPLAVLAAQGRGIVVPAPAGHSPRASLWSLATPLVVAADALGLLEAPAASLEATAVRLESLALRCRPSTEPFVNPGKELALSLAGSLPLVWGASPVASAAAYRFGCQLAENAKYPAVVGAMPEVCHNSVETFDGPWSGGEEDLFRDDVEGGVQMRLVLLRDPAEHPRLRARADVTRDLARQRGVQVTELVAEGASAYERLASLIGLLDYASVYLGVVMGIDPSPIDAISTLKARLAESA